MKQLSIWLGRRGCLRAAYAVANLYFRLRADHDWSSAAGREREVLQVNSLTQYSAAKGQLRAGDVVVFYGTALTSRAIELFATGPSHVAIIRQPVAEGADVKICHSTIDHGVNGVQTEPLGEIIADYGPVSVAALRLSDAARKRIDWFEFYKVIGASDGFVKYDVANLFDFLIRDIPVLGARVAQGENKTAMVCSSWVTAVLEASGLLTGINWTKVSPQDIVEMHIYEGSVPLLGNPKLTRFNTV
jgi:hypothetical protein